MAALGKIRKRGVALVCIIGLGLFAFIAEEAFRSCEATKNQQRQQIGEVLGNKVNVQEFQALVDEYQDVLKMTQGVDNFSEEQLNSIKDEVWNSFVNEQIIQAEAAKIGLTVTDEELQNMMKEGTNPMLLRSPFVNQQTGRFDATMLTKFLDDYKKNANNPQMSESYDRIYKYWSSVSRHWLRSIRLCSATLSSLTPFQPRWPSKVRIRRATSSSLLSLTLRSTTTT